MRNGRRRTARGRSRGQVAALAAVIAVQALAGVFFMGDALADLAAREFSIHLTVELLVAVGLVGGLIVGAVALKHTIERLRAQEEALDAARGALGEVIGRQFEAWGLTEAERDVAMLALKGLDVAEIAGLRGAASGTVRAQMSRVYGKAGVSGRAQFAAFFVEDLLSDGVRPQ